MIGTARALLVGAAMVTASVAGFAGTTVAAEKSINIGWTAWSDAEAVTKMAKKLIEENFDGYSVELTLADIAIQYQGVARGDLDMMMMAWLPGTHADYLEKVAGDVIDLGPIYTGAKLGWVVPAFVPKDEVASIADLGKDEVKQKLGEQVQGIDPGAGLMRLSAEALKEYGLDGYELVSASGAAMTAALERAVRRNEWIVVTGWSPHWKFGKHDLRYLEDPKGVLGGQERIHVIARKGFYQDNPEVGAFLARMYLPLEELEGLMADAEDTSYEQAIDKYVEENPNRIRYWLTGEIG